VGFSSLSELLIPGGDCLTGSTCESGEFLNWNIGSLASGSTVSFNLSPTILGSLSHGQVLFLDAEVVDGNGDSSSASQSVLVGIFVDDDSDGIANQFDNCLNQSNPNQRDTDFDGYGNVCDADFNNNNIVDPLDFSLLKSVLGSPSAPDQDLNGNGIVDPLDFSVLKSLLGQAPGPSGLVP